MERIEEKRTEQSNGRGRIITNLNKSRCIYMENQQVDSSMELKAHEAKQPCGGYMHGIQAWTIPELVSDLKT